jgi:hypothetical protein
MQYIGIEKENIVDQQVIDEAYQRISLRIARG